MGTVQITSAGFAALPSTAPPNWNTNLTWPAGGSINGTKTYTISDADAQQMLSWIGDAYIGALLAGKPPPVSISALQIFLAWLNGFMQDTTDKTQRHSVVAPPPISIS